MSRYLLFCVYITYLRSPRCMPVSGFWRRQWRACRCTCTDIQAMEMRRKRHWIIRFIRSSTGNQIRKWPALPSGRLWWPTCSCGQRLCADHPGWEEHRIGVVSTAPGKCGGSCIFRREKHIFLWITGNLFWWKNQSERGNPAEISLKALFRQYAQKIFAILTFIFWS